MNRLQALRSQVAAGRRGIVVSDDLLSTASPLTATWSTWPSTSEQDVESVAHNFASYVSAGYKSNGIVFAVILARMSLFAEGVFKFRSLQDGSVFGTSALQILEQPWPNGSTGELLSRMEQDVSLAGNFYARRTGPQRCERLRPDLVDILVVKDRIGGQDDVADVAAYVYYPHGRSKPDKAIVLTVDEMVHWSPIPDPAAAYRGMSWLTPVVREVNADSLMTEHKGMFFKNAATPNAWVKVQGVLKPDQRERLRAELDLRYGGVENAHKTLLLDAGADYQVIGHSFEQMQFATVQAAGENRIAAAGGVPGIVAGLKEGLAAATYSNYEQAMRRFADLFARPQWRSASSALRKLVVVPTGAELIVDTTNIAAMKEGEKARAEVFKLKSESAGQLIRVGYKPETVAKAVNAGDLSLLEHTGNVPVTLYDPTKAEPGAGAQAPEDQG